MLYGLNVGSNTPLSHFEDVHRHCREPKCYANHRTFARTFVDEVIDPEYTWSHEHLPQLPHARREERYRTSTMLLYLVVRTPIAEHVA